MAESQGEMHLGLYAIVTGLHTGAWRLPDFHGTSENFELQKALALTAERGKFDFMFYADSPFSKPSAPAGTIVRLDPLILLGALAAVTKHLGLVATASTTYTEPYNLARAFAAIDQISGGRSAWNVVTGAQADAAGNFGRASHPPHDERYAIAEEYLAVAKGLWDSWEDGAVIADKASGRFTDPTKLHRLDHRGKYFSVDGPLNASRPPQGYPVIVQAGASEAGRAFAAESAEVIFTVQQDHEAAKTFAREMKAEVAKRGRDPAHFKIMPGVCPIVGTSEKDARGKLAELGKLADQPAAMRALSDRLGQDMSSYPLDGPVPDLPPSTIMRAHAETLTRMARRHDLTLRELRDFVGAALGHRLLFGTPEQIADGLEEWFVSGAADGYNVMPPWCPGALDDFVDEVVPVLQKRGIFRTEYSGRTLRENLGLPRPAHPRAGGGRV